MVAAALVIGHTSYTRVPRLVHESQGRAVAAARRAHVKLTLGRRHSPAPAHTVIAQTPRAGRRVASGTSVACHPQHRARAGPGPHRPP